MSIVDKIFRHTDRIFNRYYKTSLSVDGSLSDDERVDLSADARYENHGDSPDDDDEGEEVDNGGWPFQCSHSSISTL